MKLNDKPGQTVTEYARANGLTVDWIYRLVRLNRLSHIRLYDRIFITEPNAQKGKGR
jgi:hypothetical protein